MRNIVLHRETTLIREVKTISEQNSFRVYLVGSQLNESVISNDINLIAVMEDEDFRSNFDQSFQSIKGLLDSFNYSDINLIKYIAINNQLLIKLKFKTQLKLTFKLVDKSNFDTTKPYLRIDNIKL